MSEYQFVLVHGSWHDGSLWGPVADRLRELGHAVETPTIAGHGQGVDKAVTHEDCVRSIVDAIADPGLTDVVLVGHSFGGTIIAKVAEQIPERLRRLVFWNAFVPEDGHSLNDEVPPVFREMFDALAARTDDDTVMLPYPIWREAFINDADEALARSAYERLSPEPYQPFRAKLDLKAFYSLELPRSYLNCLEDISLPPGEWGWHPRMSSRLGLYRLVQMPGSHEVIFTNPTALADKIVEAGRD
jgi:pimeloyl-ACP methyl ester carboxylesterase